jgi:hypothetical protein
MPEPEQPRLRGEARAQQLRAELVPLAPGERPAAVMIAAALAALACVANLVAYAAGVEIDGRRPEAAAIVGFCGLMAAAAWGLWLVRYWAVLAFQVLLAAIEIFFCMLVLQASDLTALAVCLLFIVGAGWLFWKLVRAMARIQAPHPDS